jgi:putative membrane protein insertion efficiency factor
MSPLRSACLVLIHGYRLLVSPILPRACRFEPTCSAYGLEAICRFGAFAGGWLALRRLFRCHPWGGAGFDPVPEAAPVMPGTACAGRIPRAEATAGPDAAR